MPEHTEPERTEPEHTEPEHTEPERTERPVSPPAAERPEVLVVGGGVIGLAVAWRLAQASVAVTVVDPEPGRGASWVAAGMLAPVSETEHGGQGRVELLLEAARRWPDFAQELESAAQAAVGYLPCGTVMVAADRSDLAALGDLVELQLALGLKVERLSARECRELVPALAPGVSGGASLPSDHQVDNRRLVTALLEACRRSGVTMLRRRVLEILRSPAGALRGVSLGPREGGPALGPREGGPAAGTEVVEAPVVVVAAGAWTPCLGGLPEGLLPPVRPVKGHLVRLRDLDDEPLLERTVRGVVRGRSSYLVPRLDRSVVVGATVEEQGFDQTVRGGPVHELLHDARMLVPGIDELVVEELLAGLRPGSPDNGPFVGMSELDGLIMATGHFRNGVLLAPLTAEAVRATVLGEPLPPAMAPFGAAR